MIAAALGVLAAAPAPQSAARIEQKAAATPPRLAVIIMVDQMRADYVERFRDDWTDGLKRLLDRGAWFSNVAYPYLTNVTCPGHATVSTGAFPHLHGISQNTWYDREQRRLVTCTDDPKATPIGYGARATGGESSVRLLIPAFADELRAQRRARVVTLSLKARSAIMLAGHGDGTVTWLNDSGTGWETSSAFSRTAVPAVEAFTNANPIDADYGKTWTRLLPPERYRGPDAADGEVPPNGWTPSFPHVLSGDDDKQPDGDFRRQWQTSPFADAYLGRLAAALVESLALGKSDATDVLGVSFSSPDLVGHAFGPGSHEVQDMYAQLDRVIGALLNRLDALVGPDRYVVALSADHGVSSIPEQVMKGSSQAGRLNSSRLAEIAERVIQAALGPGRYVTRVNGNDVYLEPGVFEKLAAVPAAMGAVVDALQQQPGIARVFLRDQLGGAAVATDALLNAAALSYVPRQSGDLVLVPRPGWIFGVNAATHGTASPDDQRVPLILMGPRIKPGEYREPATPADIAPTLALLCDVTMPRAEGRALDVALDGISPARSNGASAR